jgi:hypothetical protein
MIISILSRLFVVSSIDGNGLVVRVGQRVGGIMADTGGFIDIPRLLDPNSAWDVRWTFIWDMNRDGFVTISDVWLWMKWAFFIPGDFILLVIMLKTPSIAGFLEISPSMLYGWWSLFLSIFIWWSVLTTVMSELGK